VDGKAIDTVFLTGGSSFVPAVRAIFSRLFPDATISGGHELTSVATGLALRARSAGSALAGGGSSDPPLGHPV